ncbi:hypothetical protein AOLI_G00232640 [Acnodon oligacanthus]
MFKPVDYFKPKHSVLKSPSNGTNFSPVKHQNSKLSLSLPHASPASANYINHNALLRLLSAVTIGNELLGSVSLFARKCGPQINTADIKSFPVNSKRAYRLCRETHLASLRTEPLPGVQQTLSRGRSRSFSAAAHRRSRGEKEKQRGRFPAGTKTPITASSCRGSPAAGREEQEENSSRTRCGISSPTRLEQRL